MFDGYFDINFEFFVIFIFRYERQIKRFG